MNERFESLRFPYLPLRIDLRGRTYDVEALVDTGFEGDITLPPEMIGIDARTSYGIGAYLADGSRVEVRVYPGEVRLRQAGPFPVFILALGDEPTVGRRITDRFRLTLDHGERVILEP